MKSLKDSQPSDVFSIELTEGAGNVVVGVLIDGVVGDDDAFGVGEVYITTG